jgi:hypothetical protein
MFAGGTGAESSMEAEAGSIARVSVPDVEALVAKAVTKALRNNQEMAQTSDL